MDFDKLGSIISKKSDIWDQEDVENWLKFIEFEKYVEIFSKDVG
jgi:hypothetical protein